MSESVLPTVGRIVHYRAMSGSEALPAIIVRVYDSRDRAALWCCVDLVVFQSSHEAPSAFVYRVPEANEPAGHGWEWPPKVSA
jgi:hypothetical protein